MRRSVGTLAVCALLVDADARLRLRAALRPSAKASDPVLSVDVVFADTVAEMRAVVATRAHALAVVEARDRDGTSTEELIRSMRHGYPRLPILGIAPVGHDTSSAVLTLARAGVHELVLRGIDDVGIALRAALASAGRRAAAGRIEEALAPHVPEMLRPVVRLALEHSTGPITVPALARSLGIHRRTLVNWFHTAALPAPREFLAWCRLLLAATLLEDLGRPVEHIALELQYPSANAYRNTLRRYASLSPLELRERGGLPCLVAVFERRLRKGHPVSASQH